MIPQLLGRMGKEANGPFVKNREYNRMAGFAEEIEKMNPTMLFQ